MKLLFFDTETTGTDSIRCSIHQMSGYIVIDGKVVETFDIKFRPFEGSLIQEGALKVSGTTLEEVNNRELSEHGAYLQLLSIMDRHINKFDKTDKFFLVGYNVGFDKDFLHALFERNNDKYLGSYVWSNSIDVMTLAGQRMMNIRPQMINFKQGTVAKTLGIPVDEDRLHDALYDVETCIRIYCNVTNMKIEL